MRGHIRRRGKRSWAIVIDLGRDPATGKRRQRWVSVKGTKKDAETKQAELLHRLTTSTLIEPSRLTVERYLGRWLEDHVEPNLSPKSGNRYAGIVHNHLVPTLGHVLLVELQPRHVLNAYKTWRDSGRRDGQGGLSPRTIAQHHRVLGKAMRHAVQWRLLAINPMDGVPAPRFDKRPVTVLNRHQLRDVLNKANHSYLGPLVHAASLTGLRMGELLGLPWGAVDLERRTLQVKQTCQWLSGRGFVFKEPKTAKSRRSVTLPQSMVDMLGKQRARQAELRLKLGPGYDNEYGLVFTTKSGRPLSPRNLSRDFRRLVHSLDIPYVTWHGLRHTHATLLLEENVHPKVVSERLGHSSIMVTLDTYSHVLPGLQEAAADRLDAMLANDSAYIA
tara:strand:+ start:910 stop:2076 length:1167 start_codon:yes stop_codon:yes gene_type:complete